MVEGIIIRGYSGFYYVAAEDAIFECSLRGRYKIKKQDFLPGDRVKISTVAGKEKGVIEEVLPRRSELVRPPIANVTQAVIVMAMSSPPPDLVLLDRLLVLVEVAGIRPIIVFNKVDLAKEEHSENLSDVYAGLGYQVFRTSAKLGTGIAELKVQLQDQISVVAGPSGAGKSSLLNALQPGLQLKTGEVGSKSQRGKHTTRHVSLLPLEAGGLVADTPGFSRLTLPSMKREDLSGFFPEFEPYRSMCKFNSCLHYKEPHCAVKEALEKGLIDYGRYKNYVQFLEEVINTERSY